MISKLLAFDIGNYWSQTLLWQFLVFSDNNRDFNQRTQRKSLKTSPSFTEIHFPPLANTSFHTKERKLEHLAKWPLQCSEEWRVYWALLYKLEYFPLDWYIKMRWDQVNKTFTTSHPHFFFDFHLVFHNRYHSHLKTDCACFLLLFLWHIVWRFWSIEELKFIAGCHMKEKAAAMFAELPRITGELEWTTQTFQAHVFFFLPFFFSPMRPNPPIPSGVR